MPRVIRSAPRSPAHLDFSGSGLLVAVGHSTNAAAVDLAISADILAGAFTKNASGTLQLTGNNYYATAFSSHPGNSSPPDRPNAVPGTLTLSGGSLTLAYDASINTGSLLTLAADATITANRLTPGLGYNASFGLLSVGSGQTLTFNAGTNVTGGTSSLSVTRGVFYRSSFDQYRRRNQDYL